MARTIDSVGGRALEVAHDIGLFGALGEPASLEGLCAHCSCHPRGLQTLLRLLTSMQILVAEGSLVRLAEDTPRFLAEEWPDLKPTLPRVADWDQLETAVRTGKCVRTPIESETDGGEFFSDVVETLFHLHWPAARHLHSQLPQNLERVLDLGAGSAVWSLGCMTQRKQLQAVAVDHSKVLDEVTARFISEHGVQGRYQLRPGSYFEVELEVEFYDVAFLGHIVHSEGPELSLTLAQRCHQALKAGGTLVVAEMLGSEPRGKDYCSELFALNMLMFTENGCVFSAAELETLVGRAGFGEFHWVDGPGQYPVLLAKKL